MQTLAPQLSSTLMQLLFSFDRGMRVEKTLMQTLASQLSSTIMHLLFSFGFVFDQGKRKLSCKLSLLNYHQLSCNSCSRLTGAWELRKLSYKLSLLNYHQLSCNSCSPLSLTRARENSHANSRFSTLINSHATLVLLCLWPGQEKTLMQTLASQLSSTLMQLLFSFDRGMRVEKTLMQTLASQLSTIMQLLFSFGFVFDQGKRKLSWKLSLLNYHQLSCNSCSRLTGAWELRKLSCKLSLLNSHQLSCNSCSPLALSLTRARENSHANSRFSTLINSHATLVLLCLWPGQEKTLMQTLASQLSSSLTEVLMVQGVLYFCFLGSVFNALFSAYMLFIFITLRPLL
jgi:hypothetical protein